MNDKVSKEEMERMKDLTYDPTDNEAPYGRKDYVRKEFRFVTGVEATTIAAKYTAGKQSTLVYDAPLSASGLKCFHLVSTICNPMSCAMCNSAALSKYTFHRIYDDHIETNIAMSCCCWVMDLTNVYYLDRDFAQNFETAGPCAPVCTHCTPFPDCCGMYGKTVIAHGATNGVCCAGGRRIQPDMASCFVGGPLLFGFCPIGNEQWVCFPFIDPESAPTFIDKLATQRAEIAAQHNVVVGGQAVADAPATEVQSRD